MAGKSYIDRSRAFAAQSSGREQEIEQLRSFMSQLVEALLSPSA